MDFMEGPNTLPSHYLSAQLLLNSAGQSQQPLSLHLGVYYGLYSCQFIHKDRDQIETFYVLFVSIFICMFIQFYALVGTLIFTGSKVSHVIIANKFFHVRIIQSAMLSFPCVEEMFPP